MGLLKKICRKFMPKETNIKIMFVITERLKPWILLNCLEKENYIITDNKAEEIVNIIIKQAISLNVFNNVINNLREK